MIPLPEFILHSMMFVGHAINTFSLGPTPQAASMDLSVFKIFPVSFG